MICSKYLTLLIIFLFGFYPNIRSQNQKEIQRIDNIMLQIPDSSTTSGEGIATFISSHFNGNSDRLYAIFSWITENIRYDAENMFSIDFYQPAEDVLKSVLKSRTGVCLHYADLFRELAEKSGVKTYVVLGYTRQNGLIDHIPHAWCASLVDSAWFLFDPAWGSGYFQNGSFYKQRNMKYFMVSPARLIRTHIPFDPMWQFLNYPVTNRDFYNRNTRVNANSPFFNYADSIRQYDQMNDLEKMESSIHRIRQNGITNVLIYREIKYLNEQIMVKKYNQALGFYNDGIVRLNKAIKIWNEFKPEKNSGEISQLLDSAAYSVTLSRERLTLIKNPSESIKLTISQLYALLEIASASIDDLRLAVVRYRSSREK